MSVPFPSTDALLGGLTLEQFLARHWHKRPLLVRTAWPGFEPPLLRQRRYTNWVVLLGSSNTYRKTV